MTILQRTIAGSVIYSHFRYLCPYYTWLLFNKSLPDVIPAPAERLLMRKSSSSWQRHAASTRKTVCAWWRPTDVKTTSSGSLLPIS